MIDLHQVLASATVLIREAGSRVTHTTISPVHEKWGHYNYVTETDIAVQAYLKEGLSQLIPGCQFWGEEQENAALTNAYTWVVDPIDGTYNFIRCRYASSISVALLKDRQPVLALVYQPYHNELYTAIRGEGAYLNGQPIHVSDQPFDKALVNLGTAPYYAHLADATAFCFHQFLTHCGDIRRVGSAAIDCCDIASGRADIFCELELSPWDFAAGALLITEAGGIFDMPYESAVNFGKNACILAANPRCFQAARNIVIQAKEHIKA